MLGLLGALDPYRKRTLHHESNEECLVIPDPDTTDTLGERRGRGEVLAPDGSRLAGRSRGQSIRLESGELVDVYIVPHILFLSPASPRPSSEGGANCHARLIDLSFHIVLRP